MKVEDVLAAFTRAAEAGVHQTRGGAGEHGFAVAADVVAVGVGNKGEGPVVVRVEPEVEVGQVDAVLVLDEHSWCVAEGEAGRLALPFP